MRIYAQDELASLPLPPIQMLGVAKISISPDRDRASDLRYSFHGSVNPLHAAALAGGIARSIDQVEHFLGIAQTHQ